MVVKGLLVAGAVLLLAQNIYAELNRPELEKIERELVEIEITEKKWFYVDTSGNGYYPLTAKQMCASLNMTMAIFETEAKWLSVSKWLKESPYSTLEFWSGAMRKQIPAEQVWYWEKTGEKIVDFFWKPGEPSVNNMDTACMTIDSTGWKDYTCDPIWSFNVMCEL